MFVIPNKRLSDKEVRDGRELEITEQRPKVRGDCLAGGINEERPCPWVSCSHNNYLSVTDAGALLLNHPGVDAADVNPAQSCALDVADQDEEPTLEALADMMNLTRERVRQIEEKGLEAAARAMKKLDQRR